MEVLVQEEKAFLFERSVELDYSFEYQDGTPSVGTRDVRIHPFQVTQELLDKLIFAGLTPKVKVGQSIPGLAVLISFQAAAGPGPYEGSIQLFGGAVFLSSLTGGKLCTMEEAKVKLEVTKIGGQAMNKHSMRRFPGNSMGNRQHFELTPTGESVLFNSGQHEAKQFQVSSTVNDNWFGLWCSNYSLWTIIVAVKLVLSRSGSIQPDPAIHDHLAAVRKMLTDDILADTTVVAQNGAEIKFHRSLLGAHSPAFERMFETQMLEATSGVLELPDMTEESVKALKEYLYVWELKAPHENSLVCFELFEAGHKYGISTLEKATSKILLRMGEAWYSALVGLRLFLLVKDMELPDLKQKALEILKLKRAELKTLDEYRDLFEKNAAVAMELTECLASPFTMRNL